MKFQGKYFVSVLLALTLLAGWVTPAYADVTSVSPGSIVNDADRTITVSGNAFVDPSVVSLGGTALATTFVSDVELTAVVPAGFAAGSYAVTVDTTGGSATLVVSDPPPTDTPTPTPTFTPTPTNTPVFGRPQVVISSYSSNAIAQTGKKFTVSIRFGNSGTLTAINTQAVFTSSDVVPTGTGGVLALGTVPMGGSVDATQTFLTAYSTSGKRVVVIDVALTYYDDDGTSYSDKFTLSITAKNESSSGGSSGGGGGGGGGYVAPTPSGNTAQLVITGYSSDVEPLQPGQKFKLGITVQNMGRTSAKRVTMIMGGGSSDSGSGTPQAGGVSGGSGEFTNFAPLGTSNVQALGEISAGANLQVWQNLVVNVSTTPGAYPVKITFSYINSKGEMVNDEQVITLLVYSLPYLDVSFYSPPQPFFAGQPGPLPIQVVNLGKRSTILGNMKIETANGTVEPATTLVGAIDAGGYFTFDSMLTPDEAGTLTLNVTIEYTDDFNQPRTVTKALEVTVEEGGIDPAMEGMEGVETFVPSEETFLQKVWRFALGMLGLDSAPPANDVPVEPSFDEMPLPVPSGGGGGGKGG
ncbi:MAG: IPT/TIG domain-containing protein [Chloroflexi bacterium]|nr:IPT/TIG domain-containing protein [Chloroflexota bacterium]